MIKISIISILTSATILFGAFLADGVVIDHNLPQTLQPGEKTIVSLDINKGEVTGFAKLQLEIPAGLTARAIKKSGASFTFSGQKAKFIWMTLPDQQQFSVEYELEANPTACGPQVITGQFSYIKESEREDFPLSPEKIIIECEDFASDENPSDNQNVETALTTRLMTEIAEGEYFVEISSENVDTDGFAKIIENIPPGFAIEDENPGESIATIEDDQIKFVWFEKPSDETFSVSYKLLSAGEEKPDLSGFFSYVSENTPIEVPIIHQDMVSSRDFGDPIVEEPEITDPNPSDTTDDNNDVADTAEPEIKVETPDTTADVPNEVIPDTSGDDESVADTSTEIPDDVSASNVPDPETGITYKVQLAATHKYITGQKFQLMYKFNNDVQMENHEGWTKFVTGSHTIYKDARDSRNQITSSNPKFKGPFVTAYNNGERITVQEALMISKQNWYQ